MQVVENKALQFVTRKADQIAALIPKSKILERNGPLAKVLVFWGHEEWLLLRNLGVKNPPHPILGRYKWPGMYKPFDHQRITAAFAASHPRCFILSSPGTGKTNAVASSFTGVDYTLVPAAMVDLSGFHGVYIQLQGYSSNSVASYNGLNQAAILARMPIRNPFGAIETYEPDNIAYVPLPNAALTDLHIILVGDDGQQLNLHGIDWTMTMHVKYAAIRSPALSTERLLPADTLATTQLFGGRRVY
jgi:hypothetical protein